MDADKKKIWIRGQFIEVTDEVYTAYMKGDRKIRYFENDLKTGRTVKDKDGNIKQILPSREDSLDRLMEDNAQQFPDSQESVEDIVIQKIFYGKITYGALKVAKEGSGIDLCTVLRRKNGTSICKANRCFSEYCP